MSFFVGIAFDESIGTSLNRALDLARPHADAKWEHVEKTHLTVVFLADAPLPEGRLKAVVERHAPFELQLKGTGAFDDRVLWLGVQGELDKLRALQAAFEIPDRHGAYSPHVTLARAKGRRGDFVKAVAALEGYESPRFTVKTITQFESRAGQYVVRETAALR